ncbi:MAG TPA: hypothetical protein VEJ63_07555, partial [Planctomycetota bacterium]|nr:hypothetical protein [Planctomycetota bacterium]
MTSPESNASTPNWRHVGIGIALVAGFALMLVKLSSHRSTLAAADASASNAKVAAGPDETRAPQSQPEPIPVAVPGLNENLYSWKSGDVFRFDYSRTITLKQLGDDGKPTERVTEVSGFLIFEIKSVTPSGASARLRIDSPHVTLPEVTVYSSQYDDPELRQGKARAIARAMEGVLKTASWNVILGSTG